MERTRLVPKFSEKPKREAIGSVELTASSDGQSEACSSPLWTVTLCLYHQRQIKLYRYACWVESGSVLEPGRPWVCRGGKLGERRGVARIRPSLIRSFHSPTLTPLSSCYLSLEASLCSGLLSGVLSALHASLMLEVLLLSGAS